MLVYFNKAFMINFGFWLSVKGEVIMNKNVNKSICFKREYDVIFFFFSIFYLCGRSGKKWTEEKKKRRQSLFKYKAPEAGITQSIITS